MKKPPKKKPLPPKHISDAINDNEDIELSDLLEVITEAKSKELSVGENKIVVCTECGEEFATYVLLLKKKGFSIYEKTCPKCKTEYDRCELCNSVLVSIYSPSNHSYTLSCPEPSCENYIGIDSTANKNLKKRYQWQSGFSEWQKTTPGIYQEDVNYDKLPDDASKTAFVLAIDYARGLLNNVQLNLKNENISPFLMLYGKTGRGKTRCLHRIRRGFMLSGINVITISSIDLCNLLSEAYIPDATTDAFKRATKLKTIPVLCIDDLGKGRFTERVISQFFDLIEIRSSNKLPIVFTTNDNEDSFSERFGKDYASPLWRRLREFSHTINFNNGLEIYSNAR